MYRVDIYLRVRHEFLVSNKSIRKIALEFGLNRRTVKKMLDCAIPPGYRRSRSSVKPKLDLYRSIIDEILSADKTAPKKQKHTAMRIFTRLKEEHNYDGGYTIVREYVAQARLRGQEMFCPLTHKAGSAQVDFGEGLAIIGGEEVKAHFFVMDIPYSDACFIKAYSMENTQAFCDGHVAAFSFFGGVPQNILYDNTKIAVSRILGTGHREKTRAFCELQSHYLFGDRFARVGKGNDKGKVENLVGYARRNFMVPVPAFESFSALNNHLLECCIKRQENILRGHKKSIGERLKNDQNAFIPLPAAAYEVYELQAGRVSSQSLVRYQNNDYSVPVRYGYRDVLVKGSLDKITIICGKEIIALHNRCYDRDETIFNPLHYLPLLEQKTEALDQAAPLSNWSLPSSFGTLRNVLEKRDGKAGKREYVRVLRLLETFRLEEVENAIRDALNLGAARIDAIRHLILCRLDNRPAKLNLVDFPHIPAIAVKSTNAKDYSQLLGVVS